jgi:uncharacterized protein HemX
MPDLRTPRIRMPRVSLRGRGRGTARKTAATEPKAATKPAATKPAAATKTTSAKTPDPNLQERMEGLQGWMAEIERRQGRLTYFGGAAVLIAIAAAGAALYFGLTAHNDSAKKSDVDSLKATVTALQQAVAKNTKDTQSTINASISQLQTSIAALQKQQAQNSANISTLQAQVASGAAGKGTAGTTAIGTGTTAGTTTPKKP